MYNHVLKIIVKNRQIQVPIENNGFSIFTCKIFRFCKNILLLHRKPLWRESAHYVIEVKGVKHDHHIVPCSLMFLRLIKLTKLKKISGFLCNWSVNLLKNITGYICKLNMCLHFSKIFLLKHSICSPLLYCKSWCNITVVISARNRNTIQKWDEKDLNSFGEDTEM